MSVACLAGVLLLSMSPAPAHPQLAGTWSLNRDASEFPAEVGFDPDWARAAARDSGGSEGGGGRGGREGGSGSRNPPVVARLSEDEAREIQELVDEVKTPPARLTITQSDTAIGVTDDRGATRVFHPTGKDESIALRTGGVGAISRWEGTGFYVRLRINKDQELRYHYSRDARGRLVVRAQLADHGKGQEITRVYDLVP